MDLVEISNVLLDFSSVILLFSVGVKLFCPAIVLSQNTITCLLESSPVKDDALLFHQKQIKDLIEEVSQIEESSIRKVSETPIPNIPLLLNFKKGLIFDLVISLLSNLLR